MDRYDWDWNRGYGAARPWRSYDRDVRYGGGWWDRPDRGREWRGGWPYDGWVGSPYDRFMVGPPRPRGGWGPPDNRYDAGGYDRYARPRWPSMVGMNEFYDEIDNVFDDDFDDDSDEFDGLDGAWAAEPTDAELHNLVWRSLHQDGFIDAEAIELDLHDRVVTLRGEVAGYMEARYAWDDAWDVPGIRGVISKLTIRGENRQQAPPKAAKKAAKK